jgi:hypothetical protein
VDKGHQRNIVIAQLLLCLILVAHLPPDPQKNGFTKEEDVDPTTVVASNQEIKRSVESMMSDIRMKNAKYLEGIMHVVMSEEDLDFLSEEGIPCSGHLLGAIGNGTIIIKESGEETNRKTLHHEIGHNVWRQLSDEQRQKWPFSEPFVTFYASTSPQEDFADSFSCMMVNFENCMERLSADKKKFLERV